MHKKFIISHTIFSRLLLRSPKKTLENEAMNLLNEQEKEYKTSKSILQSVKTSNEKGHDEYMKNQAREKESDRAKVSNLVKKSNRLIISVTAFSLIPFHLYTNTINVEESRVTFLFKQPFTFQSHSVDIKDISNVFIESAILFASLQVVSHTYVQNEITIGYLNKSKANKVRRIIESLRTFAEANIDTSQYETPELIGKLEELHASQ